ncbi:MAG TPA: phage tail tape measure protein, partial [Mesotoga sp.]|nr:phage tail tape measure protein [Mesotoga sp.]
MPSVGDALKLSIVITSVDRFSRTFDMINRRIEHMALAINNKAGKAITQLEKEMKKAKLTIDPVFREMHEDVTKTIEQAQKLDMIGTAMIRAGMAFGVATAGIIKVSSSLEDKMTRINAIQFDPFVGLDPEFMGEITSYILELGTRTPIKTEDLAELGIVSAQLGLRGDDLNKFLDVVSMLAAIDPSISAHQWAEYMGKFRETFHLSNDELEKFGSMLTYLATSTPARAGEIAAAMFRTGQIATGLLPQDIAAVNTALIQVGMTAERAGTATRRLFIDLADVNKMKKIIGLLEFDYDFAEYKSLKESAPDAGAVVKDLYSLGSIVPEDKLKEYQILYMKDPLSLLIKVLDQFSTLAKAQGEALETPFDFSQYFKEEDLQDIEQFFLGIGDLIQDVGAPIESSLRDIFNIRGTEAVTKLLAQVENIKKIRDLAYKAWPTALTRSKSIAEYFAESIDQTLIKEEDLTFLTEMLNNILNNAIETGALETKAGFLETWKALSVIAEPFNIAFDEAAFEKNMQETLEKFDISVLQEKYNLRTESMAAQMVMAKNAIMMALYEIGIALKPLVERIAHMVSTIAKWFAKLPRWLKDGIAYTLVWGAALLTVGGIALKIIS